MTIAVVVAVEDIVVATKRRLGLMDYVHCDELPQEIIRQGPSASKRWIQDSGSSVGSRSG